MKKDKTAKLIEYLEGTLSEQEQHKMELALADSVELRAELGQLKEALRVFDEQEEEMPSNNLRTRFYDLLERAESQPLKKQSPGRIISLFRLKSVEWGIAGAVAILLIGIAFGHLWQRNQQQQAQIDVLMEEVATTRKLMVLSMLQEPSASQRIKAVNVALETSMQDPKVTKALIQTLLYDKNANVRMKAATSMVHFAAEKGVKLALVEALAKEERPEVQITIIDVLVAIKAQAAVKVLEDLLGKEELLEVVKVKAASGLEKLI